MSVSMSLGRREGIVHVLQGTVACVAVLPLVCVLSLPNPERIMLMLVPVE